MRILISSFLSVLLALPSAIACTGGVGGAEVNNGAVAIRMTDLSGQTTGYAVDDDGMLSAGVIASYCYQSLPQIRLELNSGQQACITSLQSAKDTPYTDRIFSSYAGGGSPLLLADIKERCEIDLEQRYLQRRQELNTAPLSCTARVRDLASRSSQFYREYARTFITEENLNKYELTEEEKTAIRVGAAKRIVALEKLSNLMSRPEVTREQFEMWLEEFEPLMEGEQFKVGPALDDESLSYMSMSGVLQQMSSRLPSIPALRCGGGGPVTDATITEMTTAYANRQPATAPGTADGAGEGASDAAN